MRIPLTMDGEMLCKLKDDMEICLSSMIEEMTKNNRTDGTLTAKITVHISNQATPEGKLLRRPEFHFKTTINVPVKGSLEGSVIAPVCLQKNELTGEYELIPISGTLFQEDD